MIHGTYRSLMPLLANTMNVTVFESHKFSAQRGTGILAMLQKQDFAAEGLQLPFNLITNHSFDSITVDLATLSADDVGRSDLYINFDGNSDRERCKRLFGTLYFCLSCLDTMAQCGAEVRCGHMFLCLSTLI